MELLRSSRGEDALAAISVRHPVRALTEPARQRIAEPEPGERRQPSAEVSRSIVTLSWNMKVR